MNHPSMTSRGKLITGVVALIALLLLPMKVPCGYPGGKCGRKGEFGLLCKPYELEPLGLYLIEKLVDGDVGFAYRKGEDCR